jgi:homoserine O-acetyltransferase
MRRIEPVGVNHRAVCAAALVIGPNPSFRGAPTGRRSAPPDDRLRASPESITREYGFRTAATGGAIPADVEFLNREAGAFLDGVTEGGKSLD